jgi:hypothetical protein
MLPGKRLYPYVERAVGESTGLLRFFKDVRRSLRVPSGILVGGMELSRHPLGVATSQGDENRLLRCEGAIGGTVGILGGERDV